MISSTANVPGPGATTNDVVVLYMLAFAGFGDNVCVVGLTSKPI